MIPLLRYSSFTKVHGEESTLAIDIELGVPQPSRRSELDGESSMTVTGRHAKHWRTILLPQDAFTRIHPLGAEIYASSKLEKW